jgi:hypothetical protein
MGSQFKKYLSIGYIFIVCNKIKPGNIAGRMLLSDSHLFSIRIQKIGGSESATPI